MNELTVGDLQHFIEIEVIDSGSGIDANKLEKIFERFIRRLPMVSMEVSVLV